MFSADISYCWVKLLKHRCYGAEVNYFAFSSEIENRTLYQMCGRCTC